MRALTATLAVLGALVLSGLAAAQERVVITKADLVRMAETGLPVSLIVKTVESADELPVLQPSDLTELAGKGVAPEVLEAVVERKRPGVSEARRSDLPEVFRRVRVNALVKKKRALFGMMSSGGDSFAVYWAVAALDGQGRPLAVGSCRREPACWCATAAGDSTCAKPGGAAWDERFSCFQAVEMTPNETAEILDFEPPVGAETIRVYAFYMARDKSGAIFMEPFQSRSSAAYLEIDPRGSRDYSAEADLTLEIGRGADTSLALTVRRFDDRDRGVSSAPDHIEISTLAEDFVPSVCVAP